MSISTSLSNAQSGLVAASRAAETIANNVSNVMTDGYGRQEVVLSAAALNGKGAGVRVVSVQREVDNIAIADRRRAEADLGYGDFISSSYARISASVGLPGEGTSLTDRSTAFHTALIEAESRPDSQVRLQNLAYAAADLSAKMNEISDTTQTERVAADKAIDRQVDVLNQTLAKVAELNTDIRKHSASGQDANGLIDQRQILIDKITPIVPVTVVARELGQVAIIAKGGAILLDGTPAVFGFQHTSQITTDMTLASGALSGLKINGNDIQVGNGDGLMRGGSLAAAFEMRDSIAPGVAQEVDALARNLMERFEQPGLDPTLAAGQAGLFTDEGSPLDISLESGLAGRIRLNAAVDTNNGGEVWRLRDGLGAAAEGENGDRTLLGNYISALVDRQPAASGTIYVSDRSFEGFTDDLSDVVSGRNVNYEEETTYASVRFQELEFVEKSGGVDTDLEMQKLMLVEQAYNANARVISVVDELIQTLMRL